VEEVRGKKIRITFEREKCIHARECVLGRPDVFAPEAEGDWIFPDAAPPEEIAALVQRCPSGALQFERLDGGEQEKVPLVNVVRVLENGPMVLRGDLRITGQAPRLRAALCRCGASKNKPYCDRSHVEAGFVCTGEPFAPPSPPLAQSNGPLAIRVIRDGALVFTGNVEVVSGTGRTLYRTKKMALCRCGVSANMPYCDGSHERARFEGE
jgi:CDGSH-type Zn-finger protein/uncharacterized Fe-S cluster protein YjdI